MPRLFVAVWPDPAVLEVLAALPRPERPGVRWTRPEQWHVTLRFFGSTDLDPVAAALAALPPAPPTGTGPVTAVMGPVSALLGRAVLQVPVAGLDPLAAAVAAATAELGQPPRPGPFHGHLTLARGRERSDVRPLAGQAAAATWPVGEFTLVSSVPGRAGSRYEVVGRYPVAGDGAGQGPA